MANTDIPTVNGVPDGLTIYHVEFEENDGRGSEIRGMAAPSLTECAIAADAWAKAHDMEVRWIAQDGWTEGLI